MSQKVNFIISQKLSLLLPHKQNILMSQKVSFSMSQKLNLNKASSEFCNTWYVIDGTSFFFVVYNVTHHNERTR